MFYRLHRPLVLCGPDAVSHPVCTDSVALRPSMCFIGFNHFERDLVRLSLKL